MQPRISLISFWMLTIPWFFYFYPISLCRRAISFPRGPKDQKKSRFRARLKISSENETSSEPPTAALFFCGEFETSRLKFSSEIKNFDRDWKFRARSNFLIVGPSGFVAFQTRVACFCFCLVWLKMPLLMCIWVSEQTVSKAAQLWAETLQL